MDPQTLATLIAEGGKLLSGLMKTFNVRMAQVSLPDLPETELPALSVEQSPAPDPAPAPVSKPAGVTTEATIRYQKRELVKELILLEGHLQQGCKIGGEACDCCFKHPIKIEGLAQETAGMSPDPVYRELSDWVNEISPKTTADAAASGKYDDQYPKMAVQAREFRKAIMSTDITKEVVHEQELPPAGEDS